MQLFGFGPPPLLTHQNLRHSLRPWDFQRLFQALRTRCPFQYQRQFDGRLCSNSINSQESKRIPPGSLQSFWHNLISLDVGWRVKGENRIDEGYYIRKIFLALTSVAKMISHATQFFCEITYYIIITI